VSTYYLDSSALVKRYVDEVGSAWLHSLVAPDAGHLLITSRITTVEVNAALARRRREAALSLADYADSVQAFRYDTQARYNLVELDAAISDLARDLVDRHPLRAYDAVQLASAAEANRILRTMSLSPLVFVSADKRLVATAGAEGLLTDDPNLHP